MDVFGALHTQEPVEESCRSEWPLPNAAACLESLSCLPAGGCLGPGDTVGLLLTPELSRPRACVR